MFSDKLQMLRKNHYLSQEQLADKLGVSRQSVSKWESGQGYPEIEKLLALSDYFKVSLDYLLKDEEECSAAVEKNNAVPCVKDIFGIVSYSFKRLSFPCQAVIWVFIISLCAILVFGMVSLIYGMGKEMGKCLYYLTH